MPKLTLSAAALVTLHTLVATPLILTGPAQADIAGDPVTLGTLVDRAEMIRVADALDAAVDAKDWAAARDLFTDTIRVDFTSLVGGEPATIPADALIGAWSGNLSGEKDSFHLRGNHRITFDGTDAALMTSHGYAWNSLPALDGDGKDLWEVWGTYEHGFARTEDGWRVDTMTFTATAQRGSDRVRDTPGS